MPFIGLVLHRHLRRQGTDECIPAGTTVGTTSGGVVVVMRVTTLKASADQVGDLLAYYAGLAEDRDRQIGRGRGPVDYYLDPDEPPGRWLGTRP